MDPMKCIVKSASMASSAIVCAYTAFPACLYRQSPIPSPSIARVRGNRRPHGAETLHADREGTNTGAAAAVGAIAALLGAPPSLAAGDAAAGKQTFTSTCAACHATEPGVNKIGPSLAGIVGSKSGAVPGYNFSPALKGANITWSEQELDKFLKNPSADVHGTKMVISVPDAEHRQNIIAYLATLKP